MQYGSRKGRSASSIPKSMIAMHTEQIFTQYSQPGERPPKSVDTAHMRHPPPSWALQTLTSPALGRFKKSII